jgi:hypothetical protein
VHVGGEAARAARALGAAAFASGSDIAFAAGAYAPDTPRGERLIAHELAHVVQHRAAPPRSGARLLSRESDAAERQAEALAGRLGREPLATGWIPAAPASLLSLAPELWYRGEAEGVKAAADVSDLAPGKRGVVHDLGPGTYFTDSADVAQVYAETRAPTDPAARRMIGGTVDVKSLGKVLDLTKDPAFMGLYKTYTKSIPKPSGEPYRNLVEGYLKNKGIKLSDYDAIIGPEGVRGGRQMCVRTPEVLAKVRAVMKPVTATGAAAPAAAGAAGAASQGAPAASSGGTGNVSAMATGAGDPAAAGKVEAPRAVAQSLVKALEAQGKPIVANIGGTGARHEPQHAINVNPNEVAPRNNIPNWVKAKGETIGTLFSPGQVKEVVGFGLSPPVLNWKEIAKGSHQVLQPGGKFTIQFRWPDAKAAQQLVAALKQAGFENVANLRDVVISATKKTGAVPGTPVLPPTGGLPPAGSGAGGVSVVGRAGGAPVRTPLSQKMTLEIHKSIFKMQSEVRASARVATHARAGVTVFNVALQTFVVVTTLNDARTFAGEGTLFGEAQRNAEKLRANAAEVLLAAEAQWDAVPLLALRGNVDQLEAAGDLERLEELQDVLEAFSSSLDEPISSLSGMAKGLRARADAARLLSKKLFKAAEIPQGMGTIPQAQEFMLAESLGLLAGPMGTAADDYEMSFTYLTYLKNGAEAISSAANKAYWNIVWQAMEAALAEQQKRAAAQPKKPPPAQPSPAGTGKSHAAPPPHLAPVPQAVRQKQIEDAMTRPPTCPSGNCHQQRKEPSLRERLGGEDFTQEDANFMRKWLEQNQ